MKTPRRLRTREMALTAALVAAFANAADMPPPPDVPYDKPVYNGRFTFARVKFRPSEWGPGRYEWGLDLKWNHDYPRAEVHLMKILRETTTIDPNDEGVIVGFDEPEIFDYPIAYVSEPGFWTLSEKELEGARAFVQKGGFLIFDDFFGRHMVNLEERMREILPDARFIEIPKTHAVWDTFFRIDEPPRGRGRGRGMGFGGPFQSTYYGIFENNDPNARVIAIANYNADVGEFWEFSDTGFIPIDLSNEAYKVGVNYMIYGLTR